MPNIPPSDEYRLWRERYLQASSSLPLNNPHLIAFTEVAQAQIEAIPMPISNHENGLIYPQPRPDLKTVHFVSDHFEIKCNGRVLNILSPNFSLDMTYLLIGRSEEVFPPSGSASYSRLQTVYNECHSLGLEELTEDTEDNNMPTSRRSNPNNYAYIIGYNASNNSYSVISPLILGHGVVGIDISYEAARRKARRMCDTKRIDTGDTRFNVWPRRGTIADRELGLGNTVSYEIQILPADVPEVVPNEYTLRITWVATEARFMISMPERRGRYHSNRPAFAETLSEAYRGATSLRNTLNEENRTRKYNVYPIANSPASEELRASAVFNDGGNDRSFRVVYRMSQELYFVIPPKNQGDFPRGNGGIYSQQMCSTLEQAYAIANDYTVNANANVGNTHYNVFPVRGSAEYLTIVDRARPVELLEPDAYSFVIRPCADGFGFDLLRPLANEDWDNITNSRWALGYVLKNAKERAKNLRTNYNEQRYNIWPPVNSPEMQRYKVLNKANQREVDVLQANSIQIVFNGANYQVLYPAQISMHFGNGPTMSSLKEAYENAFAIVLTTLSGGYCEDISVYPRIGSHNYTTLVGFKPTRAQPEIDEIDPTVNPTSIKSIAVIKEMLSLIKKAPSSTKTEGIIKEILAYGIWKKHAYNYTDAQFDAVKDATKQLLKRITKVDYLSTNDRRELIHPMNARMAVLEDGQELVTVSLSYFNNNCAPCSTCNGAFKSSNLNRLPNGWLCSSCTTRAGVYRCNHCRGEYHREDEGCPHYNNMPVEHVYNYSTDVRDVVPKMFHIAEDITVNGTHVAADTLYNGNYLRYGVELEILPRDNDDGRSIRKFVGSAIKGHAIMKLDSSIGPTGIEIVTAPATLAYHKHKLWNKFFDTPVNNGKPAAKFVKSWSTEVCGLHVHITRAALDKMQLSKLLVFYHEPGNATFLSRIAGRTVGPNARYCKAEKKRLGYKTPDNCGNHHDAITISKRNKGKTAEVRIFRGNATKHGIIRAIEFVDATVMWCANNSANALTAKDFITWFDQPKVRASYPELWRQLLELKYLKTTHKSKDSTGFNLVAEDLRTA